MNLNFTISKTVELSRFLTIGKISGNYSVSMHVWNHSLKKSSSYVGIMTKSLFGITVIKTKAYWTPKINTNKMKMVLKLIVSESFLSYQGVTPIFLTSCNKTETCTKFLLPPLRAAL